MSDTERFRPSDPDPDSWQCGEVPEEPHECARGICDQCMYLAQGLLS